MTKVIGRVSATEKNPTSCLEFVFWLDDEEFISPFDIIKVENNVGGRTSTTYGQIQDILHITDSPGHLSNYISSDFGNLKATEQTQKLRLSYAKATVIHNDNENDMPVKDGTLVYSADAEDIKKALGLDTIPDHKAICGGLLRASSGVSVPIHFNSDFLIGPEGAHLNISGISGLATKTSYAMFLLQAIQQKNSDIAMIILNVKGDDLLQIDVPNEKITPNQKKEWQDLGLDYSPFSKVAYFYPYKKNTPTYSNTALSVEEGKEQFARGIASNFIYTYEHDKDKLDLLFSNIEDPNFTIESILGFIEESPDFEELSWKSFLDKLSEYTNTTQRTTKTNKDIPIQSWRKFKRLITNSINDNIFQTAKGDDKYRQVFLGEKVANIEAGDIFVVDIAKLEEQLQCLVFGDIIKSVYDMKHGDIEQRSTSKPIPKKIIIFVDELNKYAPNTAKHSPILTYLLEITERGRSEGVILFSAEQFKSAIHDRVTGNCATNAYGRTNDIELSKPGYKYIPNVFSNKMNRLGKGDLIISHPVFKSLLKIKFPYPSYKQHK